MIRIAITGPESTGKTTLARALNKHFESALIDEYAREYLSEIGLNYSIEDLNNITDGHLKNIRLSQNSIQIIDTDFIVMKIWYDDKFGAAPAKVVNAISEDLFDIHILCAPDIPWEQDDLREDPGRRDELFDRYIIELDRFRKNYIIVTGDVHNRLEKSVAVINSILK